MDDVPDQCLGVEVDRDQDHSLHHPHQGTHFNAERDVVTVSTRREVDFVMRECSVHQITM